MVAVSRPQRRGTLRSRRVTSAALCVAGVALAHINLRFAWEAWSLLTSTFVWQAWHLAASTLFLRGRIWRCGVALGALGRRGTCSHHLTSTFIFCGRRGAWRHRPWSCVAGMALMALGWIWWRPWLSPGAPRYFTLQAWHLLTSTFVLRSRRATCSHQHFCGGCGTWRNRPWFRCGTLRRRRGRGICSDSHPCCFCVAGVALGDIDVGFAWQA